MKKSFRNKTLNFATKISPITQWSAQLLQREIFSNSIPNRTFSAPFPEIFWIANIQWPKMTSSALVPSIFLIKINICLTTCFISMMELKVTKSLIFIKINQSLFTQDKSLFLKSKECSTEIMYSPLPMEISITFTFGICPIKEVLKISKSWRIIPQIFMSNCPKGLSWRMQDGEVFLISSSLSVIIKRQISSTCASMK